MVYSSASFVAVLIGVVLGASGFILPLMVSRARNRMVRDHCIQVGLVAIMMSLIVLCAAVLICSRVAPEQALTFSISVVAAFMICIVGCAIRYAALIRKDESSR